MEITERLLNDAGGWQTMKQARPLHQMGRVSGVTWEPPILQGSVREGERQFRSGLRIQSKTNIENLCSCRASKEYGTICHHAVAVGLEFLKPAASAAPSSAVPTPTSAAKASEPPAPPAGWSSTEGELVELHVVLPPNIATAWQRGNITVGIEATTSGKRIMLGALPKNARYRASDLDLHLGTRIGELAEGAPSVFVMNPDQFLGLLEMLRGHPRVTLGKATKLTVSPESLRPQLRTESLRDGTLRLSTEYPSSAVVLVGSKSAWLLTDTTVHEIAAGLPPAYRGILKAPVDLPQAQGAAFLQRELSNLRPFFTIEEAAVPASSEFQTPVPVTSRFALDLEGSLNHLVGKLTAIYDDRRLLLTTPPQRVTFQRNPGAEHAAVEQLRSSGFAGPDGQGQFVLKGEQRILAFFARELPKWQRTAAVTIGSRFEHVTSDIERVEPRLEIRSSGESWFDLQFELATASGDRFSGAEIQRLLQSGQSHVRRKNGKLAVFDPGMLDEFQQVLTDCEPSQKQPGHYHIDQRHAGYLASVAEDHGLKVEAPRQWTKSALSGRDLAALRHVPLADLEGVLRPYQKAGVDWMNNLAENSFGGILADEMGLGKTLQTLAFLRHLGGRALIVCPSSLVYNWRREAERFTADRRVLTIEGSNRHGLFGDPIQNADLVVTSYALLRRDAEQYRGVEFQTVILDEAQHIKNPETQNAQAAFSVRAKHRFALTGTPVENSVRDLWSLMNFLMPGYLGSRQDFRERYEVPVSANPGGPEHSRLVKRLRPFMLRRRKRDVLADLPEKIEQVTFCDLSPQQRELYTALLGTARRQVSELAGGKDQGKARIQILTALLRLRQACCDIRLLQPDADGETASLSGKLDSFEELLLEAIDGGNRVLVFSQFVSMLQLLRSFLDQSGIEFCYLDGSTKNRGAEVDRFQGGSAPVFLISLKAGGVGLNLTAADTVVHFDPWWNPAVEAQATDRAHRIGQKKVVTSYKLIARNTIEEKILSLQQKKRQVIESTVESEEPLMTGLEMSDLEALLE